MGTPVLLIAQVWRTWRGAVTTKARARAAASVHTVRMDGHPPRMYADLAGWFHLLTARATWLDLLAEVGFEAHLVTWNEGDDGFVGRRRGD
jgi:hypothetical protein